MKRKILLVIIVLLSASFNAYSEVLITNGLLDLRGETLSKHKPVSFSGEWEFYWEQLLFQKDFEDTVKPDTTAMIRVPEVWNNLEVDGQQLPPHGYATYRLKVILDSANTRLAIKFGSMSSACKVYINNTLIRSAGTLATNREDAVPGYSTGISAFTAPADTFNIIVQVSNYHYSKGGLWNNISMIGKEKVLQETWSRKLELLLFLIGSIFIIGFYHLGLFQLNRSFTSALYFAFFCFVISLRAVLVNEVYILQLLPDFNWFLLIRLEYLTLMVGTITFVLFMGYVLPDIRIKSVQKSVIILNAVAALIVIVTSINFFTSLLLYFQIVMLLGIIYALYLVIKGLFVKERAAYIMIFGLLVLIATVINDLLYVNKVLETTYLITYGFMFFIATQAYMLSNQFQSMFNETKQLANDLEHINQNLEKTVEERTREINKQNFKLKDQNEEIKAQRDNLEKQHQLVTKQKQVITDSINYAERIQHAVLPSDNKFTGHLSDHFVFYRPRDIVSGDFYWFSTKEDKIIVVAADCTGHGVPGAFMSMLGMAFLAEISRMSDVTTPAQMLEFMREKVKQSLHQYDKNSLQKEGMDMALCMIDPANNNLEFAGAYSPLYLIRDGEIIIHKGDRQPVAVYLREKPFTNTVIDIQSDDRFYIFSDGYVDQTGGGDRQKFMTRNFRELLLEIHQLPMAEQGKVLEKTLDEFQGKEPQIDDILVIGFQV